MGNPYRVEENGSMCRRRLDGWRGYWARGEDQPVFGRNRIWKAFVRLYRMGCFVWEDEEEVVGFMDWAWRWMGVIGMDGSDGCVGLLCRAVCCCCCVWCCVCVCVCCVLSVCLYKRSQLPLMNPNPHHHTTHPSSPSNSHTYTHLHTPPPTTPHPTHPPYPTHLQPSPHHNNTNHNTSPS